MLKKAPQMIEGPFLCFEVDEKNILITSLSDPFL